MPMLRPFALLAGVLFAASTLCAADTTSPAPNRLVVHTDQGKETINRNIYGHFSEHLGRCVYEGYWVEPDSSIPNTRGIRNDVVAALRKIKIPVLRWPGGCFADEYHWQDGIGPRTGRPAMVNTHWGGVTENNHFGTHEFLDLCEQLGCEPYICGNVGSGTVREMQQWVEYITLSGVSPMSDLRRINGREEPWKLPYFGVGNENWGCGGQMTPEYYADQYRRFATYVRNLSGNQILKIACGPSGGDYHWTEVMMQQCRQYMNALALHYYCSAGEAKNTSATQFGEDAWFALLRSAMVMEGLVTKHSAIMDKTDPEKKVALVVDEWGAWHSVEPGTNPGFLYQQNTIRDALVAALTLDIFNRHCDRVQMANIAQTVNVLQAMILTDGPKMILTPTYHVFEMYTVHHGATMLPSELTCGEYHFDTRTIPGLSASASRDKDGRVHVSVSNLNAKESAELLCDLGGMKAKKATGRVLTAAEINGHNTFESPENVKPGPFNDFQLTDAGLSVVLPPRSVVVLEIE